jgi:hypothetical protein
LRRKRADLTLANSELTVTYCSSGRRRWESHGKPYYEVVARYR